MSSRVGRRKPAEFGAYESSRTSRIGGLQIALIMEKPRSEERGPKGRNRRFLRGKRDRQAAPTFTRGRSRQLFESHQINLEESSAVFRRREYRSKRETSREKKGREKPTSDDRILEATRRAHYFNLG